jgi:antitoxin CptB
MDARRKKLLFQSQHCGMKENDILLGRFAAEHLITMSDDELGFFEAILQETDIDLYNWITGKEPLPDRMKQPVMNAIISFNDIDL